MTITLSTTGAWLNEKFTILSPASLGGYTFSVVANVTVKLIEDQIITCVFDGSVWQVSSVDFQYLPGLITRANIANYPSLPTTFVIAGNATPGDSGAGTIYTE